MYPLIFSQFGGIAIVLYFYFKLHQIYYFINQ